MLYIIGYKDALPDMLPVTKDNRLLVFDSHEDARYVAGGLGVSALADTKELKELIKYHALDGWTRHKGS